MITRPRDLREARIQKSLGCSPRKNEMPGPFGGPSREEALRRQIRRNLDRRAEGSR